MAARYCNTVVMLKNGQIYSVGEVEKVLTSENIRSVFEVDAIVRKNLVTNSLYIIPLSPKKATAQKKCGIHVICGAGTGTLLLKALVDEGYDVTAGVLATLDTDFETCEMLKIPAVPEAPFTPITDKAYGQALEMVRNASMVVLTSVPFGPGNLRNLEIAKEALKRGIPTYVIDEVPVEIRDFTCGKATKLMSELREGGAIFVQSPLDVPSLLNGSTEKKCLSVQMLLAGHTK
jgi:iron complex transport system ATP-binding protein